MSAEAAQAAKAEASPREPVRVRVDWVLIMLAWRPEDPAMPPKLYQRMPVLLAPCLLLFAGCGAIGAFSQIVQPPRFEQDGDRPAEIEILTPSFSQPAGGAAVRLWMKVTNPNAFGFTLSTLDATLLLEGSRAATGSFPLGLPLAAAQTSVIPLDLSISFADLPGLSSAIRQAAGGGAVAYQLDGTVGIDAGRFGQPTFGPMLLARGELRAFR